jgi:hypothetical protein
MISKAPIALDELPGALDLEAGVSAAPITEDTLDSLYKEACILEPFTGICTNVFRNKTLEKVYRNEMLVPRVRWGRRCLSGFVLMSMCMYAYAIAVSNTSSYVDSFQLLVMPIFVAATAPAVIVSFYIKQESHQQIWCVVCSVAIFAVTVLNELSWVTSFDPELMKAIDEVRASSVDTGKYISNPISVLYLTEIGWYLTAALVFTTLMMRPRLNYLCVTTVFSLPFYAGVLVERYIFRKPSARHLSACA